MSVRVSDRVRLPLRFDPAHLQKDLSRFQPDDWVTQRNHGDWSVIPLRGPAGVDDALAMVYSDPGCRTFVDTPFLSGCVYFQHVLASFRCELGGVRLMKVAAGSAIGEHVDPGQAFESGSARLHVPVVTHPDVEFYLGGVRVRMNEGECWYLRLSDPHSVVNRGHTDRVHLVIDATVNPWLADMLTRATSGLVFQ